MNKEDCWMTPSRMYVCVLYDMDRKYVFLQLSSDIGNTYKYVCRKYLIDEERYEY